MTAHIALPYLGHVALRTQVEVARTTPVHRRVLPGRLLASVAAEIRVVRLELCESVTGFAAALTERASKKRLKESAMGE